MAMEPKGWAEPALLWLVGIASAGCSMATLGTARPVDSGETQFVLAPAFNRVGLSRSARPGPQVEFGGRYGVTENVDVGARLWLPLPGYTIDSRIALRKAADRNSGLDISLNPGVMYIYAPGGDTNSTPLHFTTVQLAALFGIHLDGGRQVVIGPKIVDILSTDTATSFGSTFNMVIVGSSLAYVWPVTQNLTLVPELSAGVAVMGSVAGFGADIGNNGNVLQFSLGLLFGGNKPPEVRCVEVPPAPAPVATPAAASPSAP
ncbi:MAG: hypothetical protein FJ100_21730 [Deltaproteobacteria bacterium]|nr:hypothetical protein [Deltaproteobacteria bacterium]